MNHQHRRCIACGRRELKQRLIRFAKQDQVMRFDEMQRFLGRGVYLHPAAECFSRATEVRLWTRSLGKRPVDSQSILAALDDARRGCGIEFIISGLDLEKRKNKE